MSPVESEQLLQSIVDFEQLRVVYDAYASSAEKTRWYTPLMRTASGHPFPLHTHKREQSSGRDFQFECYIAAVFQLSGIDCELAEPDIAITHPDFPFRIAAKRPRDKETVLKNVKKAIKQIGTAGGKGIIALDLSDALFRGRLVKSESDHIAAEFADEMVGLYWREIRLRVHRLTARTNAVGLLMNLHLPVQTLSTENGRQLATAFKWLFVALKPPATEDDAKRLMRLPIVCESGMFGARDVDAV